MVKLYVSVDGDKALFNKAYRDLVKEVVGDKWDQLAILMRQHRNIVVDANLALIDAIQGWGELKEIFIGSARQDQGVDYFNKVQNHTESIFTAVQTLAERLGVAVNKLTAPDLEAGLEIGENYNQILRLLAAEEAGAELEEDTFSWTRDTSKFTLLRSQIHAAAVQESGQPFKFAFVDDDLGIINGLENVFTKLPELLPVGCSFEAWEYTGEAPLLKFTIEGKGKIDKNYSQTYKDIIDALPKVKPKFGQKKVAAVVDVCSMLSDLEEYPALKAVLERLLQSAKENETSLTAAMARLGFHASLNTGLSSGEQSSNTRRFTL